LIRTQVGEGASFHFPWMPGLSYWHGQQGETDKLPTGFPQVLRELIALPTAQAWVVPPVRVSVPMVEAPLLLSDQGDAVTLLNWTGAPIDALDLTIRCAFTPSK